MRIDVNKDSGENFDQVHLTPDQELLDYLDNILVIMGKKTAHQKSLHNLLKQIRNGAAICMTEGKVS